MSQLFCPDCTAALEPGKNACGCGWVESNTKGNSKRAIPNTTHICDWHDQGKRCPMPSTSNYTGQWFCTIHAKNHHSHAESVSFFEEIDEMLKGQATKLHDHMVTLYRNASYWERGDNKFEVLKLDLVALMKAKAQSPQWVHWCQTRIASTIMSDMEKFAKDHIDEKELRKRTKLESSGDAPMKQHLGGLDNELP